jgi:hypothetical protein
MLGFQLIFAFGISLIAFLNTHPSANSWHGQSVSLDPLPD